MKPIYRVSLYFLIILVLSIIAPMITTRFFQTMGLSIPVILILNHILIFIVPAIIYILAVNGNAKKILSLNKISSKDVLKAILIGFLVQPIMNFLAYFSNLFFNNDVATFMEQTKNTPLWLMILVIGVTPAITEEITIRGIVLSGYEYKNKNIAAVMSGLMFGMLHLNAGQFLYAFAIGILFAYMVRATGSIYVSMITHFTINTTQLLMGRFLTATTNSAEISNSIDIMNSVPFIFHIVLLIFQFSIAVVFTFLVMWIIRGMEKSNKRIYLDDLDIDTKLSYKNESIINFPFILSVGVFLIYTVVTTIIL
ncbi:CPBP family intramembrane glutamic endopeptidase [Clostridium tarantellae]|uniref:CPBP family intramembrane metalloprotease n=1 Tax=Clostridium tarantellae TaxID=39493 RepID=A0A6I1MR04_9CLOT|nr:type II CAAX endopeptidase family protein [Clostridium tarantellae]MPQ45223.1 CPBP family intramembrane metalloprotease [Clostridium tarantellae]